MWPCYNMEYKVKVLTKQCYLSELPNIVTCHWHISINLKLTGPILITSTVHYLDQGLFSSPILKLEAWHTAPSDSKLNVWNSVKQLFICIYIYSNKYFFYICCDLCFDNTKNLKYKILSMKVSEISPPNFVYCICTMTRGGIYGEI